MENSNILVKSAVMATVVIIMIATLLSPVITDAAYNHIVQSNDGATDGVDLGYFTPQEGKTSVEVYPDTVTVTADGGTVTISYPTATKTITGDAILAIGGGSASTAKDLSLYIKSGKLYNSGVEYSSCTIKCVDNINQGSLYIDLTLTGNKTTYLTSLVDWAYLPTLGGAYGSYTGSLTHELSDVVSVGDFAGVYIASKGTDIISTNEYDLSATIERDANGNITGVKYAKATAEAAAVDGSASAYTGEDPVILTPDDDDGTVTVLTPEEWDGEDAAASTTTPTGTLVGDCYYTTSDTSATVTGPADSSAESIIIPTTVVIANTTYQVTSIGTAAFRGTGIQSISLPDQLTSIGNSAFYGCKSLALTSLPDQLTSIGNSTFYGCTSLALTSLPSGITSIGYSAFYGCTSLALTSLPSGITSIGYWAFQGCKSLALTSLPDQLTSIENSTFYGCTSLALTSLPDQLTSIGDSTFYRCKSLALTSLPDQLTSIENSAFSGCTSLALTSLPDQLTSIGNSAFSGCTSLALTSLPDQLTSIGNSTFYGCTSLALTSLPDQLTSIGNSAFYGCTSLALTSLPDQLTSIGNSAFYNCAIVGLVVASSPTIGTNALPATLTEVLNLGTTTLTTAMGITDNTVVSDSIQSLAIIQQKSTDYYEVKGSEYTLLLIIPILVIVALLYAVISAYRTKMS